jgi:hypothetical protein
LARRFLDAQSDARTLAEELIAAHVEYLKACHKDLPAVMLEADLRRGRTCSCKIAFEIAEKMGEIVEDEVVAL